MKENRKHTVVEVIRDAGCVIGGISTVILSAYFIFAFHEAQAILTFLSMMIAGVSMFVIAFDTTRSAIARTRPVKKTQISSRPAVNVRKSNYDLAAKT